MREAVPGKKQSRFFSDEARPDHLPYISPVGFPLDWVNWIRPWCGYAERGARPSDLPQIKNLRAEPGEHSKVSVSESGVEMGYRRRPGRQSGSVSDEMAYGFRLRWSEPECQWSYVVDPPSRN